MMNHGTEARVAAHHSAVHTGRRRVPRPHGHVPIALLCFVIALPAAALAVCGGGGTSRLPLPAVTHLRSYRAPFSVPTRMAVDASGNVYVTDPGLGQVIVRAPNGRIISRVGGLGHPVSVAVGSAGRIYVGDTASGSVTAFNAEWQKLLELGRGAGEFLQPSDVAVDAATGNLYVADSAAQLVKVYTAAGTFVRSFGGHGSGDGQFDFPVGVFVDAAAHQVLVADQLNYRIQIFDVAGNFLSCFGAQGSGPGNFNLPQSVSSDRAGRIYVADSVEGHIQVLDRSGGFAGYIGDFGDAAGQLRIPIGMVIDPSNRLFVAAANNARLEVFGLDAFADPETILPAVVHLEPELIDKAAPATNVASYIEVPGYSLDSVVSGSISANGISTATVPISVGDHDGNGDPDLRVEFPRAALLATLPPDGAATVTVTGRLGTKQFEAAAVLHITTCAAGTICSLGVAEPQCNEAVCIAAVGCTIQRKPDGTRCEDGNACTIDDVCGAGVCAGAGLPCDDGNACTDDSCDPTGGCVHTNNSEPCDDANACTSLDKCAGGTCGGTSLGCDDANVCTDDTCDPVHGCAHTNNAEPCDDGNACTSADRCAAGVCAGVAIRCDGGDVCSKGSCDPARGCIHAYTSASCNDADPGTVGDACDGAGSCVGTAVTGRYALLRWPLDASRHGAPTRMRKGLIHGDVCAESLRVGPLSQIQGDMVAWARDGWAIEFSGQSQIAGNVVTGGGTIVGINPVAVRGRVDVFGRGTELAQCFAARYRATQRRGDFGALPPTPGFALGLIQLNPGGNQRLPSTGEFASGQTVIEITELRLDSSSTLTLAGTPATGAVIVHIRNRMLVGRGARIALDGLAPERLLFVIDGSVILRPQASVVGSVFAAKRVHMGSASAITGALLGSVIHLSPSATIDLHPFVGW